MSELKHSPGKYIPRKGIDGEPERWAILSDGDVGWHIATIENGQPCDDLETEEATAHLLAAAPDLLECIIHLSERDWFKDGYNGRNGFVTCSMPAEKVRAAILRATAKEAADV